ncbi:MAG: hypothetical protein J7M11_01565 [Elusimicrobia bacterium]|nr:hypothetical protein [Elusimicrobiota bacterium]
MDDKARAAGFEGDAITSGEKDSHLPLLICDESAVVRQAIVFVEVVPVNLFHHGRTFSMALPG